MSKKPTYRLLAGIAHGGLADDLAGLRVEGCVQRERPVPVILKAVFSRLVPGYNGKRRSSRSDSYNQILIDLHHRRHLAAQPMCGPIGWRLPGPSQHFGTQLRRKLLRSLAGMDGCQAQHSILLIALLSARDGGRCRTELLFDVAVGCPYIHQQNNAHTLRHAGWRILLPQVALQLTAFGRGQVQHFRLRHKCPGDGPPS